MDKLTSERIKKAREEAGLKQCEVAVKLGISSVTVNRWEKGKRTPSADTFSQLAKLFNCDLQVLISGASDNETEQVGFPGRNLHLSDNSQESNTLQKQQGGLVAFPEEGATPEELDRKILERIFKKNSAKETIVRAILDFKDGEDDEIVWSILTTIGEYKSRDITKVERSIGFGRVIGDFMEIPRKWPMKKLIPRKKEISEKRSASKRRN